MTSGGISFRGGEVAWMAPNDFLGVMRVFADIGETMKYCRAALVVWLSEEIFVLKRISARDEMGLLCGV